MGRRKVNIRQVCASIRRDVEATGVKVPRGETRVVWSDGERSVWVAVEQRRVYSCLQGRISMEGAI